MYLFFMKMPCQEMLMLLLMLKLVFWKVLVIAKLQLGYNLTKNTDSLVLSGHSLELAFFTLL